LTKSHSNAETVKGEGTERFGKVKVASKPPRNNYVSSQEQIARLEELLKEAMERERREREERERAVKDAMEAREDKDMMLVQLRWERIERALERMQWTPVANGSEEGRTDPHQPEAEIYDLCRSSIIQVMANEVRKKLITELKGGEAQYMVDFLSEVGVVVNLVANMTGADIMIHRSSIAKTHFRHSKGNTSFIYSLSSQNRLRCSHNPLNWRMYNATLPSMSLEADTGSFIEENTRQNQSVSKLFTFMKASLIDVK
jgi:hypothetical protein